MKYKAKGMHLTDAQLKAFADGKLKKSPAPEMAGHIADCPVCAAALAEAWTEALKDAPGAMPKPPRGFTESVMLRLAAEQGRRREFRLYCARVAACVVAAVGLMAGGAFYGAKTGAAAPPSISSERPQPKPIVISQPEAITLPGERENLMEKAGDFLDQWFNSIFNAKETNDD